MLDVKSINITFPKGFLRQLLAMLNRLTGSVERLTTAIKVRYPTDQPDIIGKPIRMATHFVRTDEDIAGMEYAAEHRQARTAESYTPDDDLDAEELEKLIGNNQLPFDAESEVEEGSWLRPR